MTVTAKLLAGVRRLPPEQQQTVLDFVERLARGRVRGPTRSLFGLWKDLAIQLDDNDIDEARREMWAKLPRQDNAR